MKINSILWLSAVVLLVSMPYVFTQSFFNDIAISSENTFSAVSISITPTPTIEAVTNHIVFSEVQISGVTANQDFIEFYNPTSELVSLSGWRIRKKTSSGTISTLTVIPTGKSIPAHGFFLWSNSQNGYDSSLGADISNTNTLSDNNSIEIQDSSNITVDQLAWGSGTNQFVEGAIIATSPQALQSIERKANFTSTSESMSVGGEDELKGNGSDRNNNSTDFILRIQSQPQNTQSSTEAL